MANALVVVQSLANALDKRQFVVDNPMDCSTPGSPVLHYLLEIA